MYTIRVPVDNFWQLYKQLGDKLPGKINAALVKVGTQAVIRLRAETLNKRAVDRAQVLNGWRTRKVKRGEFVNVHIFNSEDHFPFVEDGRASGKPPPVQALLGWVMRKLGVSEEEAPRVAFLVARAIGRRGIRGKYIMRGAQGWITNAYTVAVLAAINAAMRDVARGGRWQRRLTSASERAARVWGRNVGTGGWSLSGFSWGGGSGRRSGGGRRRPAGNGPPTRDPHTGRFQRR